MKITMEELEKLCNYLRVVKGATEVQMFDIFRDVVRYKTADGKLVGRFITSVFQEMKEIGVDI
jgi:hypothetical protein